MKLSFTILLLFLGHYVTAQATDGCKLSIQDLEKLYEAKQPQREVMLYKWNYKRIENKINNKNDDVKQYVQAKCAIGVIPELPASKPIITFTIQEDHYMKLMEIIEKSGYSYVGEKYGTDYLYKNSKYLISFTTMNKQGGKAYVVYVSSISDFRG